MDYCSRRPAEASAKIGLRDFRIWDGNQIRTFLDSAADIRNAYAAWITPGDVLSALFEHLKPMSPDFENTLAVFLQKELLSDNFVNLEQAGHSPEERTLIARVFVDLPVAKGRLTSPPISDGKGNGIIQTIIETENEKLDPRTTLEAQLASPLDVGKDKPIQERGRFMIVGGPGQGKTTVGQVLAQLYRVALLRTRPRGSLSPEARTVLNDLGAQCTKASAFPRQDVSHCEWC